MFVKWLRSLLGMIVTLMALGAFVRTMKAGLACPDWPLCFGKIIPDFHFGVWLEFLHRADAGLVALVFAGCFIHVMRKPEMPVATKRAAKIGLVLLLAQILMGGLTVLWLVRHYIVTLHLMLATLFFCSVLWMLFTVKDDVELPSSRAVTMPALAWVLPLASSIMVLLQIMIGGLVASTYSGSVCVDWPLCNGQWVPTWYGPIGLQITHRFFAYFLVLVIAGIFAFAMSHRAAPWMTRQWMKLNKMNLSVVLLQVCVGVLNLILFIPPWLTVIHQSVALILLATNLRLFYTSRKIGAAVSPL